jgi:hypothetical protein
MKEARMTRSAVILFVESESGGDEVDLAYLVNLALQDARRNGLKLKLKDGEHTIKIIDVMEAGMAMGNRYLYASVTNKAWRERGLE